MPRPGLRVSLWTTDSVEPDTKEMAVDAIEELADDLGTYASISERGSIEDPNEDSYIEYFEAFDNSVDHVDGWQSLLLYTRRFSMSSDDWPNLGYSRQQYVSNDNSYALVNANVPQTALHNFGDFFLGGVPGWLTRSRAESFFENMVKHELLHSLIDGSEEWEHGQGSIKRHWLEQRATPMCSGYVEAGSPNSSPDNLCSDSSLPVTNWLSDLSNCTESEAKAWLDNEYDRGDDSPSPCPPGQPCPTSNEHRSG